MASSPSIKEQILVTYVIKVDGKPIKDSYRFDSATIVKEINRISYAKVVICDGEVAKETFEISESNDFKPGAKIEILVGYEAKEDAIFKGIIVSHGIQIKKKGTFLVLKCYDAAMGMTIHKRSKYFLKMKDSDIMSDICGTYDVKTDIKATSIKHPEVIQYYTTDWDFVLARAEINGCVVIVDDNELTIGKPKLTAGPDYVVTYGDEIRRFSGEVDARSQLKSVKCSAWDMADLKIVTGETSDAEDTSQGNIDGKTLAKIFGSDTYELQSTTPISAQMLKTWAGAQLTKSRMARMKGFAAFNGSSKIKLGSVLEIAGMGARFNGNAYLTKIVHNIAKGDWETEAHFGLDESWFIEKSNVVSPLSSGLLPGIHGLQNGIVKEIDGDPDGDHRILVDIPVIKESGDGVWARMSHLYATKTAGSFFMPEVGDEVVLGFLNDDPRFPVILGMMYSKKQEPPYTADSDNSIKAFVTKNQLKIIFEDKDKNIIIETPGGQRITMSDKDKGILIEDQHGNKIETSSGGIEITTPKDFTVKATGNIKLESTGKTEIKATQDFKAAGLNIEHKAQVGFKAEGSATAEVKASGMLTLKGGLVKIN